MTFRFSTHSLWLLLLVLLLLGAPMGAAAHGGGAPQLVNEPAGPYMLSAWTDPDPPRPGEFHVTIAVAEPGQGREAGPPILGAEVEVRLVAQGATQPLTTARASNEAAANKLFYEADLQVPAEGAYEVQIAVDGPQGSGEAAFAIEASASGGVNWTLMGGLGAALFVVVFAVNAWRNNRQGTRT
ncbi:MAG TPA: hypothetical protein VK879_21165 [Candidatus Sulfomarinibacteraceae bacterium]|nr:hypothetical protein [Candidatus Sulfomarinibacteraceae bacterium]